MVQQTTDVETMSEFERLLEDHFQNLPPVGEIVEGSVISIDKGAVRLDIGGMTTGVVRGHELFAESDEFATIKIGDKVAATVVEQENENGEMELSFREAGHQRVWDKMVELSKSGLTLESKILAANKGGLMMQVDALVGFMPVSQLSPDNYPRVPGGDKNRILEKLKDLVGVVMQVKVIDANQDDDKLIVSEKAVWEDDQKAVLESYKIGNTIEGDVSALTSFGAFVRFGEGLEGLVHISEIAWQRIDHPQDILKVGDHVKAQIIDLNKSKIYLSIKRLVDDPWKSVKEKYTVGQIVEGEVHKVEPFGLMVRLDNEIHGLAHISELSNEPMKELSEVEKAFLIGSKHNFEIVSIEPADHRLGLKVEGVKSKRKEEKKADPSVGLPTGQAGTQDKEEKKEDSVAEASEEKEEEKDDVVKE